MKITRLMIDTLVDVITYYPICAEESPLADVEQAQKHVVVLEQILKAMMEKFQSISPISK